MVQLLKNSARAISYTWFEHFDQTPIETPTWPFNQQALQQATVFWPTEYQWLPSEGFLEPVRLGIAHWAKVERRPIPQPYQGVCLFELLVAGVKHRIAIDYSDYVDRIERDCLATVSLYFKMQYLKAGYDLSDGECRKVLPGGYVMADRRMVSKLSQIRGTARTAPPQFDIYGRFGLEFATEIRSAVVNVLRGDPSLNYEGGMRKVPYRQSIRDASRSKICIDLPGNGDFCFRLFDYLAVGAFIIAYPHRTMLPVPLVDCYHIVYMKSDLSDLVDLCHYYLVHPDERRAIQSNAAEYFDSCCHLTQLGSWYLQQSLNMAIAAPLLPADVPLPLHQLRRSAA